MNFSHIVVLIPSYNPDEVLIQLINKLYDNGFTNIIVVNDGSRVQSKSIFIKCSKQAHIINHKVNQGKGIAIKTGLKFIKDNYNENTYIITCDGDGQHYVSDIIKVAHNLLKYKDSFILGTRNFDSTVPFRSRIGNILTKRIFYLKYGKLIYDTQTGLRGFSYGFIENLLCIQGNRYEYEMNVLINLIKESANIIQIPIHTVYCTQNKSHFNVIKDSVLIYKTFFNNFNNML